MFWIGPSSYVGALVERPKMSLLLGHRTKGIGPTYCRRVVGPNLRRTVPGTRMVNTVEKTHGMSIMPLENSARLSGCFVVVFFFRQTAAIKEVGCCFSFSFCFLFSPGAPQPL